MNLKSPPSLIVFTVKSPYLKLLSNAACPASVSNALATMELAEIIFLIDALSKALFRKEGSPLMSEFSIWWAKSVALCSFRSMVVFFLSCSGVSADLFLQLLVQTINRQIIANEILNLIIFIIGLNFGI